MKRILFLVFLFLLGLTVQAQENFYVDGGEIIWRRVFNADTDLGTIERNFRSKGCFKDFYSHNGIITAELQDFKMNIEAAGYKRMSLPIYLPNGYFSAFVIVQVKEGRYRVTVRRIAYHLDRLGDSMLSDVSLNDDGSIMDKFVGAPANVINYNFFNLFANLGEEEDDDW